MQYVFLTIQFLQAIYKRYVYLPLFVHIVFKISLFGKCDGDVLLFFQQT
jgi:hypothetical protein